MPTLDEIYRVQTDQADALDALSRSLATVEQTLGLARRDAQEARLAPAVVAPAGASTTPLGSRAPDPSYTLGNVLSFIGQGNRLADPNWDHLMIASAPLGFAPTTLDDFQAGYSTARWVAYKSAATLATCTIGNNDRLSSSSYWVSSGYVDLGFTPTAGGTHEIVVDGQEWPPTPQNVNDLPFLVGSCRVRRGIFSTQGSVTTEGLIVELYDVTDGVVRASTTRDLTVLGTREVAQVSCAVALAGQAWVGHVFLLRLRVQVVSTAGTGNRNWRLGEPMTHQAYTPDPIPYQPSLSTWIPRELSHRWASGAGSEVLGTSVFPDTAPRFQLVADGGHLYGGGAGARDLRTQRSAAAVLRFDDNAGGRASLEGAAGTGPGTPGAGFGRLYFSSATKSWHQTDDAGVDKDLAVLAADVTQVSRAATAGAADYVARIRLTTDTTYRAFLGLTSGDLGSLELGPGGSAVPDVRAYRSAAGKLTLDGNGQSSTSQLIVESTAGQTSQIRIQVAGDSIPRVFIEGDATEQGIEFGGGGTRDIRLLRGAAGYLQLDANSQAADTILGLLATSGRRSFVSVAVAGDSVSRAALYGDATTVGFELSPGNATADVRVARSAGGTLLINTNGQGVASTVRIASTSGQNSILEVLVTGDTNGRLRFRGDAGFALIAFGPGNATQDIVLWRSAAKTLQLDADAAGGALTAVDVKTTDFRLTGTQVLTTRRTGWTAPTGTAQRGTFATDTVTLINLARAVKALIDDLTTHGLIGT